LKVGASRSSGSEFHSAGIVIGLLEL